MFICILLFKYRNKEGLYVLKGHGTTERSEDIRSNHAPLEGRQRLDGVEDVWKPCASKVTPLT